MVGHYSAGNFNITAGTNGSVVITDPTVPNGGSVALGPAQPSRSKASIYRTLPSARTRRLPIPRTALTPAAP